MAVCATPTKTVQHCNFRDYIKGARSGRAVSTRLDVIRAVAVSTAAFWALTPCSLVQKYCVRLYGGREGQSRFYPPPKKNWQISTRLHGGTQRRYGSSSGALGRLVSSKRQAYYTKKNGDISQNYLF